MYVWRCAQRLIAELFRSLMRDVSLKVRLMSRRASIAAFPTAVKHFLAGVSPAYRSLRMLRQQFKRLRLYLSLSFLLSRLH